MKTIHQLTVKDGSCLYYETMGTGQPLVLLHGNGGSSQFFHAQAKTLKHFFKLYIIDCRGRGYSSDHSTSISFPLMVEDLKDIFKHEHLQKVHLLGFSDGANLALLFAQTYPQYIQSLILNAANRRFSDLTKNAQENFTLLQKVTGCLGKFIPFVRRKHHYLKLAFSNLPIQEEKLKNLHFPVLILVGEKDIVDLNFSKKLCSWFPNAQLHVEPMVGHDFAHQRPKRYTAEILSFLEQVKINNYFTINKQ